MQQEPMIQAKGLTKLFGDFRAVHDLSFEVMPGEIFGLLGPNGAGKTTTLRMLSGLLQPTKGESFIAGHSMKNNQIAARQELGFLTGDMDLYRRLNPRELLTYFGRLYEVPEKTLEEAVDRLINEFGITDFENRFCEKLSTGQKQRVSIARTLVHDPKVVILDEPTTGLDIMASEFILQFIKKIAKEDGKCVIFSTHHLDEVERLCDRIAIIHQGQLQQIGSIQEVQQSARQERLADAFFSLVA
ncbi:MAG: ABC transporter ATP-binding protein [Saprospiraceae bacterium]|jgi:sodium transport system ATP-binding protein|nr:ABC transporter ATP-binding protein [Saprospiraceae bacterium]